MFTVQDIRKATKGQLLQGQDSVRLRGVSINTRTIRRRYLFIAIKGKNFDGHDFAANAVKKGATALMVSRRAGPLPGGVPVILVDDTVKALGRLARYHRDRFSMPVIALTGSAGKTTTKEMAARVLAAKYRVLKNEGTENNHIGVPMTLLKLRPSHEIAVIETGTNQPGDIRWLAHVIRPTVVVLTNIGESHLERLKDSSGVFREKFELVRGMTERGCVIYNADNPYLRRVPALAKGHRMISYGTSSPADLRARDLTLSANAKISFSVNSRKWSIRTPAAHNVSNALAAIACGRLFKVPEGKIKGRIFSFRFPQGRQTLKKEGGCWVINDTYNANPVSLRSALQTLASLNNKGRKILVCGDMLELGGRSARLHRDIGRFVAHCGVDAVLSLGKLSEAVSREAKSAGVPVVARHFGSAEQLNQKLKEYLRPGDAVLVKGSRGMKMERIIDFLEKNLN
ncbi:MAG: UDP-N-acetylmuramoyl-tripeptide--D-alanyl-D-alanine ligase [Candidatus Omnitrophota bacterium]|nr:UDP-N-acetylmuramoyl-tripeptide--D-alanyl-D-alanine ligase [Candidatus Omnitrophota bacterium]MDZ4242370.1 UDP-N-acetylmuramoyl-tripeptide--D-alanyl-D-alanine ligase [Candidatus Omnitrophota bacterium]